VLDAEREPRGVGVALVGVRAMRRLHRDWMGEDTPTDVLSFPAGAPAPGQPLEEAEAGEVVVCVPVCVRQAEERGVPLHDEIARMMIHGALHVLGYDHATSAQTRRMRPRERLHLAWARRRKLRVVEDRLRVAEDRR